MGMGTTTWEWEGLGILKAIPAHLYSAYSFYYPRITVIELSPLYPVKMRYGKVFPA